MPKEVTIFVIQFLQSINSSSGLKVHVADGQIEVDNSFVYWESTPDNFGSRTGE